ncbi:MAG: M48 family metallopeptidase [Acidobacteria bacterium]|nr:M48 family metallopeptidase [Acidobacteriota bacterium]
MPEAPVARRRAAAHAVTVGQRVFPVDLARHPRARRYVLRVSPDGRLRLTVPRGASIAGALSFAAREQAWIDREWARLELRAAAWRDGAGLWFRGERVVLRLGDGAAHFAGERVAASERDLRPAVERHLRAMALRELPTRTHSLARAHEIAIASVSVRNQRSRWGSCSPRGAIALNWRLVQMPPDVADYVILHELAHRLHPNHSRRFWRAVERLCPAWRAAERWLRAHGRDLF